MVLSTIGSQKLSRIPLKTLVAAQPFLGFNFKDLQNFSGLDLLGFFLIQTVLRVIFTMLTLTVFGAEAVQVSGFFHTQMALKNQTIYVIAWKKQKASCLRTF